MNGEPKTMNIIEDNTAQYSELYTIRLPEKLRSWHGGDLDLLYDSRESDIPLIFGSFVMSREGIFALVSPPGPATVSGGNVADTLMMAMLRSIPDAIMVGVGTVNDETEHLWTSDFIFDNFANVSGPSFQLLKDELRTLRKGLGKKHLYPPTFIVTNSGRVKPSALIFANSAIETYVVTSKEGERVAHELLRDAVNTKVLSFGEEGKLDELAMLGYLKSEMGIDTIYHQGGRRVVASLMSNGMFPQLFLTQIPTSPKLPDGTLADLSPENTKFLFSGDHGVPNTAQVVTCRTDNTMKIMNLDTRRIRSL